jgi:O-antigen/teichoic acid export membrane protein
LIYTVAGALPMASALILLPFYVSHLSTSDFGALSIYFAFSYFIQLLTTYSFDTSLYIHFHEYKDDPKKLSAFASSAFIFMLAIGLLAAVVFLLFGDLLFTALFSEKSISFQPYGLLATATGIFQALFKVHGNLLQSREKPGLYFWSNVATFAVIAGATIAGLEMYPDSLIGPVGGRLVAAVLAGMWALMRIFREFGVRFNTPLMRATFSFNFYTFIYQLLQWVINYFDRILMVLLGLSLASVGIYNFAIQCLLIIEFILNGLHNSFYPRVVSTIMKQKEKRSVPEINRYYHGFISVIMLLICCCILFFPWAIEIFLRIFSNKPGYRESIQYIPYISLIYIFRAIRLFYAAPYGILKYTRPLSPIYIGVSAIKIGVIWLAVKPFGLYAVIAASIVAAIVEIILLRNSLGQRFHFHYNFFKIVGASAILFTLILVVEPLAAGAARDLAHVFYLICCLILLGWIYRKEIKLIDPFNILRQ